MLVQVRNSCSEFDSYRAARVKSLFNAESGANFSLDAELPIEQDDWQIGVIVGPSGSGKSSLGRLVFGDAEVYREPDWPEGAPIIVVWTLTGRPRYAPVKPSSPRRVV